MKSSKSNSDIIDSIILTAHGETLIAFSGLDSKPIIGDYALSNVLGIHKYCNDSLIMRPVSKTHQAIFCRRCGLRLVIPITIKTYWQLLQYLRRFN